MWSSDEGRKLVENHGVLAHPFLHYLDGPRATADAAVAWALQDRHVSRAFPLELTALIALFPEPEQRMPLVENLWEEHGSGDVTQSHVKLLDALLLSVGVPSDGLAVLPLPGTRAFLDVPARLGTLARLGAFCYGNEYLALLEFPRLEDCFRRLFPGADLRYFASNADADEGHTELIEDLIGRECRSETDVAEVMAGATVALDARCDFYDSLMALALRP